MTIISKFYFSTIFYNQNGSSPANIEYYFLATLKKTYFDEEPKLDTAKWKIDVQEHEAIPNGYFVELRVDYASKLFIERSSRILRFGTTEIELQ